MLNNAPFRIRKGPVEKTTEETKQPPENKGQALTKPPVGGGPPAPPKGDEYFTRLLKLIPGEVVLLYSTFKEQAAALQPFWALVCLGLVIAIRTVGSREKDAEGKPIKKQSIQWKGVWIAAVSFTLYVFSTTPNLFPGHDLSEYKNIIAVGMGFWVFLISQFYKGD